jgi:hypothetical protein
MFSRLTGFTAPKDFAIGKSVAASVQRKDHRRPRHRPVLAEYTSPHKRVNIGRSLVHELSPIKQVLEFPNQSGRDAAEVGGQAGYPVWKLTRLHRADEGEVGVLIAAAHPECDPPRDWRVQAASEQSGE